MLALPMSWATSSKFNVGAFKCRVANNVAFICAAELMLLVNSLAVIDLPSLLPSMKERAVFAHSVMNNATAIISVGGANNMSVALLP